MTSEDIINVARVTMKVLFGPVSGSLTPHEEQTILDTYYNLYGMQEEDIREAMDKITDQQWYEQAERIR